MWVQELLQKEVYLFPENHILLSREPRRWWSRPQVGERGLVYTADLAQQRPRTALLLDPLQGSIRVGFEKASTSTQKPSPKAAENSLLSAA